MDGMPMSGAATMSGALSMLMMAAMMLPSSALLLRHAHQSSGPGGERSGVWRTAIAGTGYFFVWIAISAAAVPLGNALVRLGPIVTGAILLVAGAFQFTSWKTRALECLRRSSDSAEAPFRRGLRLGLTCARCCGNLMLVLLVVGAMDLTAMAVVTVAITLERVAPRSQSVTRAIGAAVIMTAVWVMTRAAGIM